MTEPLVTEAAEEDTDSEDESKSEEGSSHWFPFFGLAVAAAAGAFIYCKKHDVPVEDIIRRKAEKFFASLGRKE